MIVESTVKIGSGGEIAYKLVGNLKHPTIIFANGSNFNYHQFDEVYLPKLRDKLGDDYSYLLYDYVGYGRSSDIEGEFDLDQIVVQHIELMDALEIPQAHLFGLSKGSLISHLVAAKYPSYVKSLGGYGTPNLANPEGKEKQREYYKRRLNEVQSLSDRFDIRITEENYDLVFDEIFIPSMFECQKSDLNLIQKVSGWVMKQKLKSMILGPKIGYFDKLFRSYLQVISEGEKQAFKNRIKSINVPTLLIHGKSDPYVPYSSSKLLAKWNPNASLEIIDRYKHNVPTLVPWQGGKIMDLYASFIKKISDN